MAPMTAAERTLTRSYGLLSSRVTELITCVEKNQKLPSELDDQLLLKAEKLLDELILDSRLVEGDKLEKGELGPREVKAFRYALGTLQQLRRIHTDEKISPALTNVRNSLRTIREARSSAALDRGVLDTAKKFFTTLADLLSEDLTRQRLEAAAPRRPSPVTTDVRE